MDEVVAEWLKYSDRDLATAKHLYENMRPIPLEIVCYHCQQSAEKDLKAFLIYSGVTPEKTHDLAILRKNCENIDTAFSGITDNSERLNGYSSQPRYPYETEIIDGDVVLALKDAEIIANFVRMKITKDD